MRLLAKAKKNLQPSSHRLQVQKNKLYDVETVNENRLELVDDTGNYNLYDKHDFELIELKFNIGDKVDFHGLSGVVKNIFIKNERPIVVLFKSNDVLEFTIDGKLLEGQTCPCIVLS